MSGQCEVYGDLTEKYNDLIDIESLIQFFNDVLERTYILDKED